MITLADQPAGWGDASANGVPAPDAPAALAGYEAATPARRSPQVRAAQAAGSRRPDLLTKAPSLDADVVPGRDAE